MAPRHSLDDLIGPQRAPSPENDTQGFDPLSDEDYEAIQRGHESPKQTARRNEREQRQEIEGGQRDERTAARAKAKGKAAGKASRQGALSDLTGAFGTAGSGLKGLVSGQGGGTLAGTALGLVAYAIGINLLRGGPATVKAWFAAKFLNKTSSAPAAPSTPATKPAAPSTSATAPASPGLPAGTVTD